MGRVNCLFRSFRYVWLACGSAQAEKRVALVIGNSAYKACHRSATANDAALVGGMFKDARYRIAQGELSAERYDQDAVALPTVH